MNHRFILLLIMCSFFHAKAYADLFNSCPETSVQTWLYSGGGVEIKDSGQILGEVSREGLGYWSIDKNHSQSCPPGYCSVDPLHILDDIPDFDLPDDVVSLGEVKLKDNDVYTLTTGNYYIRKKLEIKGNATLRIEGDVNLYVDKLDLKDNGNIDFKRNNNSDEFFLIGMDDYEGDGHLHLKGQGNVYAHLVSTDHVELKESVTVTGSITSKDVDIKGSAKLISKRPVHCGQEPPIYSTNAKYQFGVAQCAGSECKIPLNKPFTNTPLVFVMPTITSNNPDLDAPATLVVTNVTKTEATIEQKKAPKNGLGPDLNSQPMTEVSYLAIEPGVADFNGHQVIAGYIETDEASAKFGSNDNDRILYSDFGGGTFSSNPVVLHQIQTRNNSTKWMTSGKVKRTNERSYVDLFLELSASHNSNLDYEDEKIAFLATLPTNSSLEVDGYKVQFARGYYTPSQNGNDPMLDGCEDKYATSSLTNIDGIIANKQERAGGHGGWLRRCNINKNQVSFVVDEDFRDRTHIPEEVGYFAFERVMLPIDKCDYFPEMLQSNRYRPSSNPGEWIPWDGTLNISSGNGSGNNIYLNQLSKSEAIGFSYSNVSGVGACVYKDGQNSGGSCTVSAVKNLFPSGTPDTSTFSAYGNSLVAAGNNQSTLATKYNYTSLSFSPNTSIVILPAGEYWIDTINFNQNDSYIKLKGDGPVVIHYNHINFFQKSRIYINAGKNDQGDPDSNYDHNNLTFVGHGALSAFWPQNGSDIRLNANVYVSPESASAGFDVNNVARFQMTGSITAPRVTFRARDNSYIKAQGVAGCYTPPEPTIKYIKIEPNNYHLTCGDTGQVYVTPYDENNQPMGDVDGKSVSISAQGVVFSGGSFDSQNKRFVFDIDSREGNRYGEIPVTANVVGTAIEDTSDLIFVSLKFEINNEEYIELIAGQQKGSIPIKALACDSTGKPISLGYSVDLDESNLTQTQFIPSSGNSASLELDASVTNGEGSVSIKFDESGMFEGDLKAPISCDDFPNAEDCPESTIKEVVGKVKFKARPWKIAICDVKETAVPSNLNPASTNGDTGFMASGDEFSITYRPIAYSEVNLGADECQLPITTNYALDNGPLPITRQVIYPSSNANAGDLILSQTSPSFLPSDSGGVKVFKDNSWNEVGSFEVKTYEVNDGINTANPTYLGMTLDSDSQLIGRFYPKYFSLYDQAWVEPNSQSYIYMNQNFDSVSFEVEALNSKKQAVINYANVNYSSNLRAKFNLMESGLYTNRFVSPDFGDGSWTAQIGSVGEFSHSPNNNSICGDNSSLCWIKQSAANNYEDGPFNLYGSLVDDVLTTPTDISIVAGVGNVDPVEFVEGGQKLTIQPDIRFGRIDLDDVGGNSGTTITIPLRAEYWNGSRFVLNEDDNATNVEASTSASDVIWSEDGSITTTVTLANGGQVSDGESRNLTASQGAGVSIREQVQLWQNMDDIPWLRYDWNSDKVSDEANGEQDPSTVVTFGIYRGNDRVIYRGESGLTGQ
ncbi:MSHA biogenesis protein MshQ [Vibrio lentus]|uniref:DUF6701 domain-containing protein n=1 Tax=Vibrio lentus TaxID=136468 RepID=UPI000CC89177|nr:DUF6701 domain-containing protein [Vibrio lentus]PMN52282.1 MSHA biogenesis protein MshQ [Vibrio lentus]